MGQRPDGRCPCKENMYQRPDGRRIHWSCLAALGGFLRWEGIVALCCAVLCCVSDVRVVVAACSG